MHFSDTVKKQIVEGFIDIFSRLANKEYQRRVWIQGRGPECDNFDDVACDFFLECDSIIENYVYFEITPPQHHLLVQFRDVFRAFSNENDFPEEFIDTPEWARINEMAIEILDAFDYRKRRL
jgi:hypothetical protein